MEEYKNVLVSVIIPVFNVSAFLVEALDSVIYQSYSNLDIIIINDGSTDGSEVICNEYALKDKRIRVIHQKNIGLSAARNVGLDLMKGDYVVFLDSDDAYHLDYIKKMMNAMQKDSVDIVICKYINIKTNGPLKNDPIYDALPKAISGTYDKMNALYAFVDGVIDHSVWNKLYQKKLWENVRFPLGKVYEDIDTMYKLFHICAKVCIIDETLYYRRIHSGSITSTKSKKNFQDELSARRHFESYIKKNIPQLYTLEQLNRWKKSRLCCMINFYKIVSMRKEDKLFVHDLRRQIISLEKETGLKKLWFRTKFDYYYIYLMFVINTCLRLKENEDEDIKN